MRRAVVVALSLLAAAVVVGGLWVWLAPTPNLVVEHGGAKRWATESDPAKLFGGIAVFALLSFGLGAAIGLGSWFGLRSTRGPAGLSFVTLMSLATSVVSLKIAETWAQAVHGELADHTVPGVYRGTVKLWLEGQVGPPWLLLVCAPAAAVLVYLVCVISSSHADLGVGDDVAESPIPVGAAQATADGFVAMDPAAPETGATPPITSADEEPRTRP